MTNTDLQVIKIENSIFSCNPLEDLNDSGKRRDWDGKKVRNELLSLAYESVNLNKAIRLRECATFLSFKKSLVNSKLKLNSMNSCRVRLCPMCTWRRSLKIYSQTKEIVNYIAKNNDCRYIMLTLTVKNCSADDLSSTLDSMMKAWNRFIQLEQIDSICKGWYRSLEITHDCFPFITKDMYYGNPDKHIKPKGDYYRSLGLKPGMDNPNYDLFHPHFHVLIATNKSYFHSRKYINQSLFAQLWANSLRVDYQPRIDVRSVEGSTMDEINHAVCEVAKYACKDSDFVIPDDWDLTVNTIRVLDRAIDNRRLVAYGGLMKEVKKLLKQDDAEDGDLVHVGDDDLPLDGEFVIVDYWWYSGFKQYYEI